MNNNGVISETKTIYGGTTGITGPAGKDATINGITTVELTGSDNVNIEQQGNTLKIDVDGYKREEIDQSLEKKVDKVEGKDLSTNDFDNDYKDKLDNLSNYDDSGLKKEIANINTNKADKTEIPTKLSQLDNDNKTVTDGNYTHTDNNFDDEYKNKLDGLNNYDDTPIKKDISSNSKAIAKNQEDIKSLDDKKVDKVDGKDLSTNDFTNEDKKKLDGLSNYDDTKLKEDISNLKEKDISQDEEIKKVYNNQLFNTVTGTSEVEITDAYDDKLSKFKIEGNSKQDTTTGANLFDYDMALACDDWGSTYNKEIIDGEKCITGTVINAIPNVIFYDNSCYEKIKPSCKYTIYFDIKPSVDCILNGIYAFGSVYHEGNITLKANQWNKVSYLMTSPGTQLTSQHSVGTYGIPFGTEVTVKNILIGEGTITEYEPYTGGQPSPSPDYPQEIESITGDLVINVGGKNLFNKDDSILLERTYNDNGDITTSNNYFCQESYIKVEPNTTYTITGDMDGKNSPLWGELLQYDENHVFLLKTGSVPKNIITLENTKYIRVGATTSSLQYFKIEKGEVTNPYTPFTPHDKITIPLGDKELCKINNVTDKLNVDMETGDVSKIANIEKIVLSSNLNWKESWFNLSDYFSGEFYDSKYNTINSMCNKFFRISPSDTKMGQYANAGYIGIRLNKNLIPDLNTFKSYVDEQNITVYVPLTSPTTDYICTLSQEDLEKLKMFVGYNDITIDSNLEPSKLEITYTQDTGLVIKNLQEQIDNLSAVLVNTSAIALENI